MQQDQQDKTPVKLKIDWNAQPNITVGMLVERLSKEDPDAIVRTPKLLKGPGTRFFPGFTWIEHMDRLVRPVSTRTGRKYVDIG